MTTIAKRRPLLLTAAAVLAVVGWCLSAYPRGMFMAWFDQSRGHYEVRTHGLLFVFSDEPLRDRLFERYGVLNRRVGDCMLPLDEEMYSQGYNAVSRSLLRAKFGKDVELELAREVDE